MKPVPVMALALAGCVGAIEPQAEEIAPGEPSGIPVGSGPAATGGRAPGAGAATAAGGTGAAVPAGPPGPALAAPSGARRLSRVEYDNTVRDLLGVRTRPAQQRLPEEPITPDIAFDNDYTLQQASTALVTGAEALAREIAAAAVRDPAMRGQLVPCTPRDPGDAECLRAFLARFGRRALRRPLADDELAAFIAKLRPHAVENANFFLAVELALRAFLQHPELLYRIEVGTPVAGLPGVFRLNGHELATRLSYFLLGTTPDDALLDQAAAGRLGTPAEVRAAATRLLADGRARERIRHFHAHWLAFVTLPHEADLAAAMLAETRALVDRVVFDRPAPYADLFLARETFIGDRLARHYGLPSPGTQSAWTPYPAVGEVGRVGILSHGTVLSAYAKAADTSPVLRGRFISTRLLCRPIPEPPPDVDVDDTELAPGQCKRERLVAHAAVGACAACHQQMDPIGFGLESYDRAGRYRTTEPGRPQCPIDGEGSLPGLGRFRGPAALAEKLVASGRLDACLVRQVYRFAAGRHEATPDEEALVAALAGSFASGKQSLRDLLLELVASPAFAHRREERSN